jgi:hypothetical protein
MPESPKSCLDCVGTRELNLPGQSILLPLNIRRWRKRKVKLPSVAKVGSVRSRPGGGLKLPSIAMRAWPSWAPGPVSGNTWKPRPSETCRTGHAQRSVQVYWPTLAAIVQTIRWGLVVAGLAQISEVASQREEPAFAAKPSTSCHSTKHILLAHPDRISS